MCKITCEKHFYHTLNLFCAKIGWKKQLLFEKWEHFENGQKWPPGKSYSLCKILTSAQKWKMQKKMLKEFLQHIAVVLCRKWLEETANIGKMRPFLKLPKMTTKLRLQPLQNPNFWIFHQAFTKLWETSLSALGLSSKHYPITIMKTGFQHPDFAAGHNKA